MYPGGNTCYGFYSFYDQIAPHDVHKKYILKGGPGAGKSSFMKAIANELGCNGIDIEYHWCSSDNNSLDGIVAGDGLICMVDGTAPHIVDPHYPGAVDLIINMGDFWDERKVISNKRDIVLLTGQVDLFFQRAYNRLKEAHSAWWEWSSYYPEAVNTAAVNRNIVALSEDFIAHAPRSNRPARHLFAAALTPEGIVSQADSLIEKNYAVFAVKGSPGSGIKDLFKHIEDTLRLNNIYGEIYHCPFDPNNLDLIILPDTKTVILDISSHIVDYEKYLSSRKYKRMLDFDQFLDLPALSSCRDQLMQAKERFQKGLQEATAFMQVAKNLHDELETNYVPAMDFDRIADFRQELVGSLLEELKEM
jgi:DNA polymerase III delta prime subunit